MIVTSNVPFERWDKVFGGDEVIAAAILDRLLHFSHVFSISGPSYQMRGEMAQMLEKPTDLCNDTT